MKTTLKCQICDDVIGAYEAMIILTGGLARKTSRADERDMPRSAECYHHDCYVEAHGEDPVTELAQAVT